MSGNKGMDLGTNMIVAGMLDSKGNPVFKNQRDAFYRIVPKTKVNSNSIRLSLDKRGANYIIDEDQSFIVIGEDALQIAIERNDVAQRPMARGVVSPKEKAALPMLKLIIETLIGKGSGEDVCVFSVPAKPIDDSFDVMYHRDMMSLYLQQMGYVASPINEAYAIALSELLDEGLTGVCISWGAGMVNTSIVHEGDSLIEFSVTRSGDFIDQSVANALDISSSLVQMEKEAGTDLLNPNSKIMEAVSVYYNAVITYAFQNIAHELKKREKSLPLFREPIPVVVSGGLTLAKGFVKKTEDILNSMDFPVKVGSVRKASDPMRAVANGCFLASNI